MDTDVKASYLTATGTVYAAPSRIRGVFLTGTGTVVYKDGGASGTTLLTVNNTGTTNVIVPAKGVRFLTDIHATVTGVTGVTTFYG
jgi:hypothetical protein